MNGLSDALSRFNKSATDAPEKPADEGKPGSEKSKTGKGGKGHSYHVHVHSNGEHHLTVHGKDGQLTHHSIHNNMAQATDMMKQIHGETGPGDDQQPPEE